MSRIIDNQKTLNELYEKIQDFCIEQKNSGGYDHNQQDLIDLYIEELEKKRLALPYFMAQQRD